MPASNQVAKKDDNAALMPAKQAANLVQQYAAALVSDERAKQFAFQVSLMTKDPKNGYKIANCTPESLVDAMMNCVHFDLMPNTKEGYAYIIPYGTTAQFQIGYKGLVELAYRSGVIKSINAELVFSADVFEVELGTERRLIHRPSFDVKDRTSYLEATHVYATARLNNGEAVFEVLTKADLEKVRKSSKASAGDSPWSNWPEAMAKKTAVKRLLKLLPSSSSDNRFKTAMELDNVIEGGGRAKYDHKSGQIIDLGNDEVVQNQADLKVDIDAITSQRKSEGAV